MNVTVNESYRGHSIRYGMVAADLYFSQVDVIRPSHNLAVDGFVHVSEFSGTSPDEVVVRAYEFVDMIFDVVYPD
jgi:hypothetical protein